VLMTQSCNSALELIPANLPDGNRMWSDSYLQHRMAEFADKATADDPAKQLSPRKQKHKQQNGLRAQAAAAAEETIEQMLDESTNQGESPRKPAASPRKRQSVPAQQQAHDFYTQKCPPRFVLHHSGVHHSGAEYSAVLANQSPVAQAAEEFLRSPPVQVKKPMPKDISGGSLARVSTMASLEDLSVASVADVWKECLSEMRPHNIAEENEGGEMPPSGRPPWMLVPQPPSTQKPSRGIPRGLGSMRDHVGQHRKGAPSYVEPTFNGTPRVRPRLAPVMLDSIERPSKAPRLLVAPERC